jgi:glycine betaine/choline ABC-type transport system substrate-binding protein
MKARAILVLAGIVVAGALAVGGALGLVDLLMGRRDRVVVASKAFTESVILAEITCEWLEQNGVPVDRRFYLGATNITFEGIRSGAVDMYPEYTGTGLMAILQKPPMEDRTAVLRTVKESFEASYGIEWLAPFGFDNTYALAMPEALAARLGIDTISDLLGHTDLRAGFASEFLAREDGWLGLEKKYDLHFNAPPASMEAGLMYQAAASGQLDVISAYSTDGRIDSFHLRVLRDDRSFFPPYEAMLMVRDDALARTPRLRALLEQLDGTIDEKRMRRMNAEVDLGTSSAEEVAREFLASLHVPVGLSARPEGGTSGEVIRK